MNKVLIIGTGRISKQIQEILKWSKDFSVTAIDSPDFDLSPWIQFSKYQYYVLALRKSQSLEFYNKYKTLLTLNNIVTIDCSGAFTLDALSCEPGWSSLGIKELKIEEDKFSSILNWKWWNPFAYEENIKFSSKLYAMPGCISYNMAVNSLIYYDYMGCFPSYITVRCSSSVFGLKPTFYTKSYMWPNPNLHMEELYYLTKEKTDMSIQVDPIKFKNYIKSMTGVYDPNKILKINKDKYKYEPTFIFKELESMSALMDVNINKWNSLLRVSTNNIYRSAGHVVMLLNSLVGLPIYKELKLFEVEKMDLPQDIKLEIS